MEATGAQRSWPIMIAVKSVVGDTFEGEYVCEGLASATIHGTCRRQQFTFTSQRLLRGDLAVPTTYHGTVSNGKLGGLWSVSLDNFGAIFASLPDATGQHEAASVREPTWSRLMRHEVDVKSTADLLMRPFSHLTTTALACELLCSDGTCTVLSHTGLHSSTRADFPTYSVSSAGELFLYCGQTSVICATCAPVPASAPARRLCALASTQSVQTLSSTPLRWFVTR